MGHVETPCSVLRARCPYNRDVQRVKGGRVEDVHNRRAFLRAAMAAGAAWATASVVDVEEALAWAGQQRATSAPAAGALSPSQSRTLEAVTARILPSVDGRPGAREAGAIHFIDRALATFNRSQASLYTEGVQTLDRQAGAARAGAAFVDLTPQEQDRILRGLESTPFFQALRFDTLVGTFALPTWGGNTDHLGWHLLGFEHQPRFQAPFGFYDAEANRRG